MRPDQRCTGLTQAGFGHGSFRKIQAAVKSWKQPSTTAAVAKPAFRWIGSEKKRRKYPFDRGSWRASSPALSETRAPAVAGTRTHRHGREPAGGEAATAWDMRPFDHYSRESASDRRRDGGEAAPLPEHLGEARRAPVLEDPEGTGREGSRVRDRPGALAAPEHPHRGDRGHRAAVLSRDPVRGRQLVSRGVQGDGADDPRGAPDGEARGLEKAEAPCAPRERRGVVRLELRQRRVGEHGRLPGAYEDELQGRDDWIAGCEASAVREPQRLAGGEGDVPRLHAAHQHPRGPQLRKGRLR